MIVKLLLVLLIFSTCVEYLSAQDFLQTKYSINDIKKQRENFKNEKVRSIIVKDVYSEKVYEVDTDGKILLEKGLSDNPYLITHNYDNNGNLINCSGPFAHEFYEYDEKGNVMESAIEESTYKCYYDSQNRLVKQVEFNDESLNENCSFEKVQYSGDLIMEIIYSCCKENYALIIMYKYTQTGQLFMEISFLKNCSDGTETDRGIEEYFYNEKSVLPFKMIKDDNEIIFTYEYYD